MFCCLELHGDQSKLKYISIYYSEQCLYLVNKQLDPVIQEYAPLLGTCGSTEASKLGFALNMTSNCYGLFFTDVWYIAVELYVFSVVHLIKFFIMLRLVSCKILCRYGGKCLWCGGVWEHFLQTNYNGHGSRKYDNVIFRHNHCEYQMLMEYDMIQNDIVNMNWYMILYENRLLFCIHYNITVA